MRKIKKSGFALPTVLIASVVMLIVLLASLVSTAATRVSLGGQYYIQIAKSASDAGAAYARACLVANNGVPLWANNRPLKPGTDCSGNQLAGFTCPVGTTDSRCFVMIDTENSVRSTFSVADIETDSNGVATDVVSSGEVQLFRTSTQTTWRTWTQSSRLVVTGPTAQALIVGGGGGGGGSSYNQRAGGGGGAGGLTSVNFSLKAQSYSITVGAGGTGGAGGTSTSTNGVNGSNGGTSQITGVGTASGGGGGGRGIYSGTTGGASTGANGASGGGAGGSVTVSSGGTYISGQGRAGGDNNEPNHTASGGGGGAGGTGGSAGGPSNLSNIAGVAGVGVPLTITGSSVTYATGGPGQIGGTLLNGANGTANTGNGAQGGRGVTSRGGTGGSGIVIISFPTATVSATFSACTPTVTTIDSGATTVYQYKTTGTTCIFNVTSIKLDYKII